MKMYKLVFIFSTISLITFRYANATNPLITIDSLAQKAWVDSVYSSLSEEERIGQLLMIAAYSNKGSLHADKISESIRKNHLGGLIFMQGGPGRQIHLLNRYQSQAKIPLLIAFDGEWGLPMRLDSTTSFPKAMTLGAVQNNALIYEMGQEIAYQCKQVGVHVNFAPVADVNVNPNNPVIGNRSFGENRHRVALKSVAYMKGMQDAGIIASAKHFPGHGDTDSDSHYTLPVINHSKERMDSIELYPFKELFRQGIMSTMVAHVHVPVYDNKKNKATTLSRYVVTDLLKEDLGFNGLVFTDALNMKGVSKFYPPGQVDLLALLAGNDVLLFSEDPQKAIKKIKRALKYRKVNRSQFEKSVKKILMAKYWAGLDNYRPLTNTNLPLKLNSQRAHMLRKQLYESAITVVKKKDYLPFVHLDTFRFASLSIGTPKTNDFTSMLDKYASFQHFQMNKGKGNESLIKKLSLFNMVIVSYHKMSNRPNSRFGVNQLDIDFLKQLTAKTEVVVSLFGNPYALVYFHDFKNIICAYEEEIETLRAVPQVLFGALEAKGKLPVSPSPKLKEGMGIQTEKLGRLRYGLPEEANMNSKVLAEIDLVAQEAIKVEATPGCQILVVKNGMVVFEKAYGHFTYKQEAAVTSETMYDLASVTKTAATLQAIMWLTDRGELDINRKASFYLKELKRTNKKKIKIKDILLHQAGLTPYIPHWKRTKNGYDFLEDYYRASPEGDFTNQIALGLYSAESLRETIWKWTLESKLRNKPRGKNYGYKYSDVGFYLLQGLVEKRLNQSMDEFLDANFYSSLGLRTMTYLPLCKYPIHQIAPTENDHDFRNALVCGMVHDEGAALYGGIAGHAGIFSNANDMAILMQMNLQKGYYGGIHYFKNLKTIDKFIARHDVNNRRGLGWDKPSHLHVSPTSRYSSPKTFGHTGFSGTAAWVDPEFDIVYIFLSNRIHPYADNKELVNRNIRTRIMDLIYESIFEYEGIDHLVSLKE